MSSDARPAQASILVADDDAVSLQFLASALRELGCAVSAVGNGRAALAACAERHFDLLLLDRRMPDLGGAALLRELRERGVRTSAIATSAELDSNLRHELEAAGYIDALTKPIGLDCLAHLLAEHLPEAHVHLASSASPRSTVSFKVVLFDDVSALASVGGDWQTLHALRALLAQELRALILRLSPSRDSIDVSDLRESLHRLRASCRYCGADALGAAAQRLEALAANDNADLRVALAGFADLCTKTAAALSAQDSAAAS